MYASVSRRGFHYVLEESYPARQAAVLLEESSAIGDYEDSMRRPGSSYLWVGDEHHLNREQVAELVTYLQRWLDDGTLRGRASAINQKDKPWVQTQLSAEEEAEIQAAIDAWIPWWRRPTSQAEWDKLVEQKEMFAASAIDTHKRAVESKMPQWFIERVAKSKYQAIRKYKRTKRRAEIVRRWPTWGREERLLAILKFDL